jgi:8-oxo-dGTP diphosphatase
MTKIQCTTLHGETKEIDVKDITMRPAAYGIVEHDGKLLLVNTKSTGKWFLPGGAIEQGELSRDALRREIHEETGIEVEIGELFKVHESFFYYDPWDKGFQNISFIYLCQPKTFEVSDAYNEELDEAEKAQWISMGDLKPGQFQDFAGEIFREFLDKKSGTIVRTA